MEIMKENETSALTRIDPRTEPEPRARTCTGIVRFHFWGEYSETLVLQAPDVDAAAKLADYLNEGLPEAERRDACGNVLPCVGLAEGVDRDGVPQPRTLIAMLAGRALAHVKERLTTLDPEPSNFCSLARSIDRGPVFRFTTPP